jgi:hypothetical protein
MFILDWLFKPHKVTFGAEGIGEVYNRFWIAGITLILIMACTPFALIAISSFQIHMNEFIVVLMATISLVFINSIQLHFCTKVFWAKHTNDMVIAFLQKEYDPK